MTKEEKNIYNAYLESDKITGLNEAEKYLKSKSKEININLTNKKKYKTVEEELKELEEETILKKIKEKIENFKFKYLYNEEYKKELRTRIKREKNKNSYKGSSILLSQILIILITAFLKRIELGLIIAVIIFTILWFYSFLSALLNKKNEKIAWIVMLWIFPISCYFYIDSRNKEK